MPAFVKGGFGAVGVSTRPEHPTRARVPPMGAVQYDGVPADRHAGGRVGVQLLLRDLRVAVGEPARVVAGAAEDCRTIADAVGLADCFEKTDVHEVLVSEVRLAELLGESLGHGRVDVRHEGRVHGRRRVPIGEDHVVHAVLRRPGVDDSDPDRPAIERTRDNDRATAVARREPAVP